MPELFKTPLAIVDVETNGTSYKNGGVIDIGILRVEDGQVVQTMRQLINPGSPIPAFITQLTGITNEDLADAPAFADVATDVYEILEDCIFIAHNVRFDYAFIKEELLRTGYQFRPLQLCTVRLSRALYPQHRSHKLDALIERFNLEVENRHRAFADAQAAWQALQIMAASQPKIFNTVVKQQLRQPALPPQLSPAVIENLPESPGVYIFESENNTILYVGKSVNIRQRVLSHFSDDHRSAKELQMAREITNIQVISTNGELGALLKESQLIKELLPIYNRMLRRKSELVVATKHQDKEGYPTIMLERKSEIDVHSLDSVMAVYKSERQAKEALISLSKQFHLCHKLLGLQKTTSACFQHQLKHCPGACVGKESNLEYLVRFNQAFESTRIQHWPFDGPILVSESGYNQSSGYVIDKWCILGEVRHRDQEVDFQPIKSRFDLDQYKIFKNFLNNSRNRYVIKPFSISQLELLEI